jgi:hypothetical protein
METFGAKLAAGYKVFIEILFDAEGKIIEFQGCPGFSQVGGSVIFSFSEAILINGNWEKIRRGSSGCLTPGGF